MVHFPISEKGVLVDETDHQKRRLSDNFHTTYAQTPIKQMRGKRRKDGDSNEEEEEVDDEDEEEEGLVDGAIADILGTGGQEFLILPPDLGKKVSTHWVYWTQNFTLIQTPGSMTIICGKSLGMDDVPKIKNSQKEEKREIKGSGIVFLGVNEVNDEINDELKNGNTGNVVKAE